VWLPNRGDEFARPILRHRTEIRLAHLIGLLGIVFSRCYVDGL